jgi:putative ABC transport system permease protein
MIRIALRGLLTRKLRVVLTATAIVLGVAMVSGTFVLTDTINNSFNTLMASGRAGTSAVISARSLVTKGSTNETPAVSASLLERVRSLSDVVQAYGMVKTETARMIDAKGNPVGPSGPPAFGYGRDPSTIGSDGAFKVVQGHWAKGPDEVAIDVLSAKKAHVSVGDTIRVENSGPLRRFRIVGLLQWGSSNSLGGATVTVFDLTTAQKLFGLTGRLTEIDVRAKSGITPKRIVSELKPLLPPHAQALTVDQQIRDDQAEWASLSTTIGSVLLVFAAIAFFIGAFVIFNTLSITVAQRTREMATLRTIGASRRQVLGSVLAEGLTIGAAASVVGVGVGMLLARALSWLVGAIGIDVPRTATVYAPRTFVLGLATGIIVTLLASLGPALRATRVPPIAAVREGSLLPRGRFARLRPAVAGLLLAISLAVIGLGMFRSFEQVSQRMLTLGAGCGLFFLAVALLASYVARPLTRLIGAPSAKLGGAAGKLARENAMRMPTRTASTAAALMIGLALVTFVSVLAHGLARSTEVVIKKQVSTDYVVTSKDGYSAYSNATERALARVPGVEHAIAVRSDNVVAYGKTTQISGIDPRQIRSVYHFDWKNGSSASLAELGKDGAILTDSFARKHKLAPGDRFAVTTPDGRKLRLRVVAVNKQPELFSLLGQITVSTAGFDAAYGNPKTTFITYLRTAGGQSDAVASRLRTALDAFPSVQLQTEQQAINAQSSSMSSLLAMFYVLLGLSVVVSVFGIVNTLALAVFERTRELGMLRAVGMTKRQTRRMIRHESVTISLIGAVLGIPVGVFLAALATSALRRYDVVFSLPYLSLIVFTLAAVLAGVLAAILPARRAARLNVLEALQYE